MLSHGHVISFKDMALECSFPLSPHYINKCFSSFGFSYLRDYYFKYRLWMTPKLMCKNPEMCTKIIILFTELSLSQTRNTRIKESMEALYSEATIFKSEAVLITTADEDKRAGQNSKLSGIETTINVILHVKKIKRDLHIQ